jgi:ABC-type arginine transport system permease subunit
MVDICPIWTVMVISISTIARIMAAYFGSKSISAIPAISMGIPEAITVISGLPKYSQLFKSCLV